MYGCCLQVWLDMCRRRTLPWSCYEWPDEDQMRWLRTRHGPIPDPWMMLADTDLSAETSLSNRIMWEWSQKWLNTVVYIIWNVVKTRVFFKHSTVLFRTYNTTYRPLYVWGKIQNQNQNQNQKPTGSQFNEFYNEYERTEKYGGHGNAQEEYAMTERMNISGKLTSGTV